MNIQLDKIDCALLSHLQGNARITNTELARRVDLSPQGLQKRLRKLEKAGVIDQYVALINREPPGYEMLCFVTGHPEATRSGGGSLLPSGDPGRARSSGMFSHDGRIRLLIEGYCP